MTAPVLSDIAAILSKLFSGPSLSQINRSAPLFSWLPKRPYGGKACDWRVAGSGLTVSNFASGGAAPTATFDERIAATLAWGRYGVRISVADDAYSAARQQGGDAIFDLFREEMELAAKAIAKDIENDLFAGAGTSNTIAGVAAAILDSGTYAGIDSSSKTWFKSGAFGTAGSELAMTLAGFGDFEEACFDQFGAPLGEADAYFTTSSLYGKYTSLLGANPQQVVNSPTPGAPGVDLAGGARSLSYNGVPVLRSGSCTAERIYALCRDEIELRYLPVTLPGGAPLMVEPIPVGDTNSGDEVPAFLHVKRLGASGAAEDFFVYAQVQLVAKSRFAHGIWRTDIDGTA